MLPTDESLQLDWSRGDGVSDRGDDAHNGTGDWFLGLLAVATSADWSAQPSKNNDYEKSSYRDRNI